MTAANDNELPRTPAEARASGSARYFTGKPCKHGHVSPRFTSNRRCIVCSVAAAEQWKRDNPDYMDEYRKEYYAANKDALRIQYDEWYAANREDRLDAKRTMYEENREAHLAYAEEYRAQNPEKVKAASGKRRKENPEKLQESWQRWYAENGKARDVARRSTPHGKIDNSISRGIYVSLKGGKAGRSWESLVGYTIDDLMRHLEKKFLPGMTWDNYGMRGWHIDHVIPRSAFNYQTTDDIDFHRCWGLKNLQPLWEFDNLSKGAKTPPGFQPSLALAIRA